MKIYLSITIIIMLLSCNDNKQNAPMSIRYTSMNDVYANYIFNFENNRLGLKMINDYALSSIEETKNFRDSIFEKTNKMTELDKKIYFRTQSFPLEASDIIFFNELDKLNFDQPTEKDILIKYEVNKMNFKVTNIIIPNRYLTQDIDWDEQKLIRKENVSQIKISQDLTLEVLAYFMSEINKLGFHLLVDKYEYHIINNNNLLVTISYSSFGEFLEILY